MKGIKFLEKHKLSKLTQGEIRNLNIPSSIKEIESLINNLPKMKTLGPYGFIHEFYQIFKGEIILILYNILWK